MEILNTISKNTDKPVCVVTGGAQGIGKAIATHFLQKNFVVIIADKASEIAEKTIEALHPYGEIMFFYCDVSQPADCINLFAFCSNTFGRVDVLINNAGIGCWKSPYDLEVEEWDLVMHTSLRSCFICSREAAKIMRKQQEGGCIILIASTRAVMSEPNSEAYAAAKGGITALTHALAASFAQDHIRVNCISPGWIETLHYDDLKEIDHKQHFSGRVGKPEDIARLCVFLADPANSFIDAENITIDGGMTRKMQYAE